jgi:hypothetical protein
MTGEGNGQQRPYHISISGAVANQIKREGLLAKKSGGLKQFNTALRAVELRLRTDPLGFGELTREERNRNFRFHTGSILPISVRFAIDLDNAVVYIEKVIFNSQ